MIAPPLNFKTDSFVVDLPNVGRRPSMAGSHLKTLDQYSEQELAELERRAIRKLDWTILPVMAMFYLLSFLDRSNIGNARVAGLQKDLHLTDRQYQICITVFYLPYIASELPSTLLLKKIGPQLLLPTLLVIWGIIAALQGFVTSYGGLVAVRAFLGLVEGPLSPGIILYLSAFYTRKELSLRIALFYTSASLSGAFSGLLASAIEKMDGLGGRTGWSWIFILEGFFSALMGIISFFLVPSTPRDSKVLTEDEKDIVMQRLEKDRPTIKAVDKFSFKEVFRSMTSPHVIVLFVLLFMIGTMIYGMALFLPSIVKQLGFSSAASQLLSIGPFGAGVVVTLISAYYSDRYESRAIAAALVSVLSVAGFSLYLRAEHRYTSYGALYLMVPGVYGTVPVVGAWLANNSEPHYRRATSVALGIIAANAGGVLSTWSFPTKAGPKFRNTTIMNLIFSILIIVGCLINRAYLSWRNKVKKHPGVREKLLEKFKYGAMGEKEEDDGGLNAWIELGDRHPDFVYTL